MSTLSSRRWSSFTAIYPKTKAKLGNSEVKGLVQQIVNDRLAEAFEEDPTTARKIADKCVRAAQAREAARKARELTRKGGRDDEGLSAKLADCSERDPQFRELFLGRGDGKARRHRVPLTALAVPALDQVAAVGDRGARGRQKPRRAVAVHHRVAGDHAGVSFVRGRK